MVVGVECQVARNNPCVERMVLKIALHLLILTTLVVLGRLPAAADRAIGDVDIHELPLFTLTLRESLPGACGKTDLRVLRSI